MSFFAKPSITAKRVGPNLVASFASANPPLIWKFDLERNHSFSLAMQGEEGDWELGLTSTKGEFYPVAHFPVREDAEEAMAKVQKILLKRKRSKILTAFMLLLGAALLAGVLFMGWGFMLIRGGIHMPGLALSPAGTAAPVAAPSGIPLPADDVLRVPPHQ